MTTDFRADQVRLNRLISSGSTPILVYPSSSASDLAGGQTAEFVTSSVGTDVFFFVSGATDGTGKSLFGGDAVVSGNVRIDQSLAQGNSVVASGLYSHAQGFSTNATNFYTHAEGISTTASGFYAHAEGNLTTASGIAAHAEGLGSQASGNYSHAEGDSVTASGQYSHAEGSGSISSGKYSHAEGDLTTASGMYSHTEGTGVSANGTASHAEGTFTIANGDFSHAEGSGATTFGSSSHAEGFAASSYGDFSHAEGAFSTTNGLYSHAEGYFTLAHGEASHAEGFGSETVGTGSFAAGLYTVASGSVDGVFPPPTIQAAFGKYNLQGNTDSLFVVGDGLDASNRHDVFRVSSGSVQVTGSLIASKITGSIQNVDDANTIPFLTASTNITLNYNSLGQWEITGSGGGFTASQLVALTQASSTELDADSLAYVVIDPSGTPTSRKTTLGLMGALPNSWVNETYAVIGPMSLQAGTVTAGICFQRRRDGQQCTGVRLYWDGGVGAQTLTIDLWEYSTLLGAASNVATGTMSANAQGIISGTFSSAYTLLPDKLYVASWHNTSYWPNYLAGPYYGMRDRAMYRDYVVIDGGVYKSGGGANGAPDTSLGVGSGNIFEIEPLVSG